jgi:hypothetical protein
MPTSSELDAATQRLTEAAGEINRTLSSLAPSGIESGIIDALAETYGERRNEIAAVYFQDALSDPGSSAVPMATGGLLSAVEEGQALEALGSGSPMPVRELAVPASLPSLSEPDDYLPGASSAAPAARMLGVTMDGGDITVPAESSKSRTEPAGITYPVPFLYDAVPTPDDRA